MDKASPSPARIAAMVAFTMSCFGLLVFLWISFGGAVPLAPQSYRFHAQFDEAALLVDEAEVRISGLTVGHVKSKAYQPAGGVLVEMEIDRPFAPIPADARAVLRQKTLLGQIYVELTPGSPAAPRLPDGGRLAATSVEGTVEIDELIGTFDKPVRRAFQGFTKQAATAIDGNAENLNDALGSLPRFVGHGGDLLEVLDEQKPAVRLLVRNAGTVFDALSKREGELGSLVTNANGFFGALASRNDALAETIRVLPTFLAESKLTVERLQRFATDARPSVRDLIPAARRVKPTIQEMGALAPDLRALFSDLDVLISESDRTLPQGARFLQGRRAGLRGVAQLPARAQPVPLVCQLSAQPGGRLHHGRWREPERGAPGQARRRPPSLPPPVRDHQLARDRDPAHAPGVRPRQRLSRAQLPEALPPAGRSGGGRMQRGGRHQAQPLERQPAMLRAAQVAVQRRADPHARTRRSADRGRAEGQRGHQAGQALTSVRAAR